MRKLLATAFVLLLLVPTTMALAEPPAGTFIVVEGNVEVVRRDQVHRAEIGAAVLVDDEIRTGTNGRARIVLRDNSVLNVAKATSLILDKQLFDPAGGLFETLIEILEGKIRALVTEYYHRPGASYTIKTPTAVSGVRGTEFVVAYESSRAKTEVTGISGRVRVTAAIDPDGQGVIVTAQETTTVAKGSYPTPPQQLEDDLFQQYLEDFEFIGMGGSESMLRADPYISGAEVPLDDDGAGQDGSRTTTSNRRRSAPASGEAPAGDQDSAGNLSGQPPAAIERLGEIQVPF